jgi:TonB family protein
MFRFLAIQCFVFVVITGRSQSNFITEFYSAKGQILEESQGSDYCIIRRINLKSVDTLVSFYSANDGLRFLKIIDKSGLANGQFTYYFRNGKIKSKGINKDGNPVGIVTSYYENGLTQAVQLFEQASFIPSLVNYYDSSGRQLIKDGNGYCACYFDSYLVDGGDILEKGKLNSGKRDSLWTGYRKNSSMYYKEQYQNGKLIAGISYDSLGNQYNYDVIEKAAEPKKGMMGFYQHVARTLRYPASARRYGIEGKVFVEFVVNEDGSISDVKSIKGIGYGCDEEAVKAIQSSLHWLPGIQRGQVVKQRMVLPITFKLG